MGRTSVPVKGQARGFVSASWPAYFLLHLPTKLPSHKLRSGPMTHKTMLAAVYARISDDRLGEGLGVRRQLKAARELVAQRGGTVVLERDDNDVSAFSGAPRPGYQDVMAAAEAGEVTHIVAWQQSRLWRNRRERADGIERLKQARVSVVLVQGQDIDMGTAYGRGMAGLLGEFDTMESEVKSERQRAKVAELVQAGKIGAGGPRPFGYKRSYAGEGPRRKILGDELDPKEADIVREMANRVLAGESVRSLVGELNSRGITTSTGRPWTKQSLRWLLKSGRIAGLREHKGKVVGPAVWPAIIDRETHEQLRSKLSATQEAPGARVRTHYLTGFVRCQSCNAKMKVSRKEGALKYVCLPKQEGGCNGRSINLVPLVDLIDRLMVAKLSDPETLAQLAQREAKKVPQELLDAIEADQRRLEALEGSLSDSDSPVQEITRAIVRVRLRLAQARTALSEATATPEIARLDFRQLAKRWKKLHIDQKQTLLKLFVSKIEIGPGVRGKTRFDYQRVTVIPA